MGVYVHAHDILVCTYMYAYDIRTYMYAYAIRTYTYAYDIRIYMSAYDMATCNVMHTYDYGPYYDMPCNITLQSDRLQTVRGHARHT